MQHDSLTLFWKAPEDDGNSEIIEYILEYHEITKTSWTRITQISDTSFTVSKLKTNSEYVFRTIARNKVGESPPSPTSEAIKILAPLTKEAPVIQEALVDITVGIKQKVTLSCIIGGSPAPQIKWYKNGKEFTTKTMVYENRVAKFTIDETTESTESKYTCIATNEVGTAETSCQICVQEKPTITVDENLLNQKLRTSAQWKVNGNVLGFPRPDLIWYKNGVKLSSTEKCVLQFSENDCTIDINSLQRSDSGKYTIEAKNKAGVVSVELTLNVIDKPDKPEQVAIKEIKKDSVVIEWKPPTDDGGLEIVKYSIEKCDPENMVWIKVAEVEKHIDSFCIQKLLANAQYVFRVMAANPIGVSEPIESDSVTIKVKIGNKMFIYMLFNKLIIFFLEPPSAPRFPTEVTGMSDTALTLVWQPPERDGGGKIIEYTVEIKETTVEKWRSYGKTIDNRTNISIENLIKDTSYEFRICARNDAGTGPPLITEDAIIAGRKISKFDLFFKYSFLILMLI